MILFRLGFFLASAFFMSGCPGSLDFFRFLMFFFSVPALSCFTWWFFLSFSSWFFDLFAGRTGTWGLAWRRVPFMILGLIHAFQLFFLSTYPPAVVIGFPVWKYPIVIFWRRNSICRIKIQRILDWATTSKVGFIGLDMLSKLRTYIYHIYNINYSYSHYHIQKLPNKYTC